MSRLLPLSIAFIVIQASFASVQDDPCDPKALLPPADPAYAEAMKLSKTLTDHGIQVRCVSLSKEAQMFEGQIGAANFRNDIGSFEALFLPQSQTWDELKVVGLHYKNGYTRYHFEGVPKYSGTWEGKSVYFIKHRNQFLHTLNQQAAEKLSEVLKRD